MQFKTRLLLVGPMAIPAYGCSGTISSGTGTPSGDGSGARLIVALTTAKVFLSRQPSLGEVLQ